MQIMTCKGSVEIRYQTIRGLRKGFFALLALFALTQGALAQNQTVVTVDCPPPQDDEAGVAVYRQNVQDFEAANPGVTIEPHEVCWDPATFPARLAGGQIETVFLVQFTDPNGLIARDQVADMTEVVRSWEHFDDLNPNALRVFEDAEGRIYGVPSSGYALGLVYNRTLFEAAGLDPNDPPRTWDEVREYARQLTDRSRGVAGFAQLSTANAGGWHFTAYYYSFGGGELVEQQNGEWVATFNDETGVQVLQMIKDMRWEDQVLTDEVLLTQDNTKELMAAERAAMMIIPAGAVGDMVVQYGVNAEDFGAGPLPQAGGNATLIGGAGLMFSPRASEEQLQAGFDWVAYRYFDPEVLEQQLQADVEADRVVGIPGLPILSGELEERRAALIAQYANVPVENFAPYAEGTAELTLQPEPPIETQQLYQILDSAVQAVLTDRNADPQALLDQAAQQYTTQVLDRINP